LSIGGFVHRWSGIDNHLPNVPINLATGRWNAICDQCVERQLATFAIKTPLSDSKQNLQTQLHQICGVDLTKIPGIKEQTAQIGCF
jgi:hypothetical protein